MIIPITAWRIQGNPAENWWDIMSMASLTYWGRFSTVEPRGPGQEVGGLDPVLCPLSPRVDVKQTLVPDMVWTSQGLQIFLFLGGTGNEISFLHSASLAVFGRYSEVLYKIFIQTQTGKPAGLSAASGRLVFLVPGGKLPGLRPNDRSAQEAQIQSLRKWHDRKRRLLHHRPEVITSRWEWTPLGIIYF